MRARVRSVAFGAAVATLAAAAVIACSSSDDQDRAYDVPDGAPPPANLPEAAPEADVPPARDAGDDRPPFDPADEAVTCASAPCATEIVAGANHFCARLDDGTVRCWGDDAFGALGGGDPRAPKDDDAGADAGSDAGATNTTTVAGLSHVTQLSAGGATTCARVDDGTVHCWGSNDNGQLALSTDRASNDQDPHPVAAPVTLPGPAARVDVGDNSVCATLASGELWCWGNDEQGQLARDGIPSQFVMVPGKAEIGALAFTRLTLGTNTFLGLTQAGDVTSWGAVAGADGILGGRMTSVSPDSLPVPIAQLHGASSLAATSSLFKGQGGALGGPSLIETGIVPPGGGNTPHGHACAIVGGAVSCWGKSDFGALCTGFPDIQALPAAAPVESKSAWPQQVAVGDEITCVRMTDGTVQCCGDDTAGRLGTEKVSLYSALFVPADAFVGHAVHVSASNRAVCALVQGGTVECWGGNAHGELGMSAPDDAAHPSPSKVAF